MGVPDEVADTVVEKVDVGDIENEDNRRGKAGAEERKKEGGDVSELVSEKDDELRRCIQSRGLAFERRSYPSKIYGGFQFIGSSYAG
ncbi:hypothetical protein Tcan_06115 [Toxocara canis]|uniref:Uncharacterized protein n=1 Tax=Toxocara canis TaxID=6265 RepID=A0A0B2VAT3_TOXCA|nr:hypothetical protein Tcan_06115 [Toxocara canis]